jgi:arylamine N-acetyltransferase
MANWLCATFPGSPFIANLIVARPGRGHPSTLFNRRFTIRDIDGKATNGSEDDHEIHIGRPGSALRAGSLSAHR